MLIGDLFDVDFDDGEIFVVLYFVLFVCSWIVVFDC